MSDNIVEERLGEKKENARLDGFGSVGCISFGFRNLFIFIIS